MREGDKMKLLLVAINAKYIHSNLAIYSLRAYAKEYQANIKLAEYTINHSIENIIKEIYKEKADVIAFSCYIWNFSIVTQVAKEIKKVLPKAKIWYGGPEVSYDSKECLETYTVVDGIMIGEGEQTFLELISYYADQKGELEQIQGLAFKESAKLLKSDLCLVNSITLTPSRQPLDLDTIPFPYDNLELFDKKIIYYESSRGCPYSCSYCLSSIDRSMRIRSSQLVIKELQLFLNHKIPQVKFVDRTFNCNKKHAMDIWQFIKDNDNGITNFHFEISADILSEEELLLLATLRPGQIQFEIGVQSTNLHTIDSIHRKMDFDKLAYIVRRIEEGKNIHQHLDLIVGLPYEDFNSFGKSFNDVYALRPDQLQMGFLKVLKGSRMEKESEEFGIVYQSRPPYEVLFTNWISYEEILLLKEVCEMIEIYYNSGQFNYAITYLEHFYDTPIQLYSELSLYYETKQLDQLAHSRIRRYEILLDFYIEKVIESNKINKLDEIAVFEELLVLDLYLREDMKSRPKFAKSQMEYKKIFREFYEVSQEDRTSTHLEHFNFDVIISAQTGQAVKKEQLLLFDYSNRDPLSKAAKTTEYEQ